VAGLLKVDNDCSRFRVLRVHPRRNARNTLLFLDRVTEEMPFPSGSRRIAARNSLRKAYSVD